MFQETMAQQQHLDMALGNLCQAENQANSQADSFSLFAQSFSALLQSQYRSYHEILTNLLRESLHYAAKDINIEPTAEHSLDIFFRIGDVLHKIMRVSNDLADSLRAAVEEAVKNYRIGSYGVKEATFALLHHGNEIQFDIFIIPQPQSNNIIIRHRLQHFQKETTVQPTPQTTKGKKNIDKKIFIWQMGKVGSSTIFRSLIPYSKPSPWLVPSELNGPGWVGHNNIIQTHSTKLLYDFLHYSNEEFVIISLVRDLMARNISTIFQSMNYSEAWRNNYFIAPIDAFKRMTFEQQELAIISHLKRLNTSTVTTSWYDNLLKSHIYYPDIDTYFIDIYAKPFDHENGYQIYKSKTDRIQMIIIRLEDLADKTYELGSFLGVDDLNLLSANLADSKWYQPIYRKFKERYKPTDAEIEAIYNSKFMKYFYSAEQISLFKKKWTDCAKKRIP